MLVACNFYAIDPDSEKKQFRHNNAAKQKSLPKTVSLYNGFSKFQTTTFNTAEYKNIKDNRFFNVINNPLSTFSIDVDTASYSNVRRFVNQGYLPPKGAVRVEELINYFDYHYPEPKFTSPFSITTEFSICPWNTKHKLLHIGLKGKSIAKKERPSSNLVFLIDVSGSMADRNKLPLIKSSLHFLIKELTFHDTISIVTYAGTASLTLPATGGDKKNTIYQVLSNLQASGSTAGSEGINLAYKVARENFRSSGNNRVILVTDGDFNIGIASESGVTEVVEKQKQAEIYLTILGVGSNNFKDSKLEKIAQTGNGNFAYIDNILEAKKVLVTELGGTLLTIAKDVKIQIEFNPIQIQSYKLIGYENRLLSEEGFNNDNVDAGEMGAGHTVTALYEVVLANHDEAVVKVDDLKYQKIETKLAADLVNELATIKVRYKKLEDNKSQLLVKTVDMDNRTIDSTSDDFRFSAAVAQFGLFIRKGGFNRDKTVKQILKLAQQSMADDLNGNRADFIQLLKKTKLLLESNYEKSY